MYKREAAPGSGGGDGGGVFYVAPSAERLPEVS